MQIKLKSVKIRTNDDLAPYQVRICSEKLKFVPLPTVGCGVAEAAAR